MYVTVSIIFIQFDILSFDISYVVTLVWPPKRLRNRIVARGRKRLCTTGIEQSAEMMDLSDFVKSVFEVCETYLAQLNQLSTNDKRYFFWVTSAAFHMCVNSRIVKLHDWPKYIDLMEKIACGLHHLKSHISFNDLPVDMQEEIAYCQELFMDTFKGELCDSKEFEVSTATKHLEHHEMKDQNIGLAAAFEQCKISISLSHLMLP